MRTLRPYAPALLAVLSWPVSGNLQTSTDLDGAWQIALHQGVHDGLNYGPDLLFTYGPFGSLHRSLLVYPWPARFAFAWVSIAQVTVAAAGAAHQAQHIEGVAVSRLEKIRAALHRSRGRQIIFDGGRVIKRLIRGTAANAHILSVPPLADHPAPFRLDQAAKTIAVINEDREGDVRFRFTTMPIR